MRREQAILTAAHLLSQVGFKVQLTLGPDNKPAGFEARRDGELTPSQTLWVDEMISGLERMPYGQP